MFGIFKDYENKHDELEMHLRRSDREVDYLVTRVEFLEKTLKTLLEHLELKEVKVEAFTQLVKVNKP